MDIAISAYYFCILKILCTLYWIYSQYSDKCWTCNGSLQVPYRVIQDCCLDYFLWSLLGRVKQTYYLLLHLSRHLLKPFIPWRHGGSSVKTQKHTKGWYNLSFSSSAWSRKQITMGTWHSCLSLKLWKWAQVVLKARGHQHQKNIYGVDFFAKAFSSGLTNYVIRHNS